MAENPVLKEAKKRGILSTGTTNTGNTGSAATQSGSANPVVRQFNGTLAKERAANQQKIIDATKAQTPTAQTGPVVTANHQQNADSGFDLAKFMVGTLGKGANAIAKAGGSTLAFLEKSLLEPIFPGITESTPIQDLNRGVDRDAAYLDSKYSANTAKGGKAARIAEDVGVGVIQAIPQAVAALGTAGSSLAAQGLSRAASASPSIVNTLKSGVSQMAKNPNFWTSFLTTVGNDYESAKADGADDTRAGLYAVADSLLGAAVEVAGGIQKLPAELQGNRFTVRKWIDAMLDEGKEEVVQGVLSRGLENVVYNKGNAIVSTSDEGAIFNPLTSAKEFGTGAAVGGILGGAQGIASNILQNRAPTARNVQTAATEDNSGPVVQNVTETTQNAAPEVGTAGGIKAGQVTTIRNPYRGEVPTQTARQSTTPVQVSRDSLTTAQNRIAGARGLESSMPGQSFKGALKNAYKGVFKAVKGVQVEGMTFNGQPYTVDINSNVPGKVISDVNLTAEKLALLDNLTEVVQNGAYVGSGEYVQHGSRNKPVQRYDYFETPVTINGEQYIARFDVEAYPTVNNYRTHQITKIDLIQSEGRLAGPTPVPSSEVSGHSEGTRPLNVDFTIAQGAENVKTDPLLQLLSGGKRAELNTLTEGQQNAVYQANEAGTVGMDAAGRVFQINPEQHIDRRGGDDIASRRVNAFQFDHPQLHPYYKAAAETLLTELAGAQPGGQTESAAGEYGQTYSWRTRRSVSPRIAALLDGGMSYGKIGKALDAIIHDQGQENYADAKRVEMVLDEMLTNGYNDGTRFVPANEAYVSEKDQIAGSGSVERGHGLDGIGAANAGSLNSDFQNLQMQSDTFHPEGANAARPVDVPTTNFEGRNIPRSASNIMGAQAIDDSDVRFIEQQIADGRLAFDTIRDTDAVSHAQQTIAQKGFDGALEQYRQAVNANVATKNNTALGQQLLLQAMREGNVKNTAELLSLYTRNSTTAAQAMQAQSIMRKLSPEGQLTTIQRALDDLNRKYSTDVQLTESEVSDFLNAKDADARQKVRERIETRAAQSVPGTFRAKYDALRYLAMLGNPRTHIRNILGNTLFQVPVAVKNRVGAMFESVANRASGGKIERTKAVLGPSPFGSLAKEARADWANAKDFLEQSSKYTEGQSSLSSIEQKADAFSNENAVGRTINKLSEFNSDMLALEDTVAKQWIYTQSLAGYLKANGIKSIKDAPPDLLNRARNYAAQEALRNTFNDRNKVSDAVAKLGNLSRSDNPIEKAAGYMVEGTLPFKRTPANVLMRSVEYSPVGAVLGAVETARGAKAGDVERVATGLDRVAAGVSGTALLAAGFLAAGAGYITGGEDEDEKQQGFNDLTGHQSYALELEDGTSVTLDWLAPEAIPFFVGVEMYNAGIENGLTLEEVTDALKNASAPMLEMSMLQGLNDTVNNAAYAVNRGDSVLGALAVSALTNYLTQIFPTVGGQLERAGETERMSTYVDKNSAVPSDVQYTIGKVSQKIPGWDYNQIPYIDAWGRTEETGSEAERIFNNFFNPAYVSQVDVDKVEQELQRVKDATGDSGVFPARAEKSITVNGDKKHLTADEYQKYATAVGQSSYQLVKDGMNLPAYKSMSDASKAEFISKLYQYAKQTAKADISNYEVASWVGNAQTSKQDIGVSTAEYIALYEKYGSEIMSGKSYEKTKQAVSAGLSVDQWAAMKNGLDADGNDSVSQAESTAYLNSHDFSHSTKADLWTIINKSWKNNPYT